VLVGIEIRIHRVLRDQGGQHALVGLGHIAHGEQGAAGTARDGRAHLGEVELQPCGGQLGLGRTHLGRGLGQRCGPRVGLLARDRILGHQLARALVLRLRQPGSGTRAFELGLGAGQGRAIGPLVDHEQQLALLHLLALGEGDALDIARHARAQLHRLHGLDAAVELVPGAYGLQGDLGHLHLGRGRRAVAGMGIARAGTAAAGKQGQRREAPASSRPQRRRGMD
jgi:hypothetical protein